MSFSILDIDKRLPNMKLCWICNVTLNKTDVSSHLTLTHHNAKLLLEQFPEQFTEESATEFINNHSELKRTNEIDKIEHIKRLLGS